MTDSPDVDWRWMPVIGLLSHAASLPVDYLTTNNLPAENPCVLMKTWIVESHSQHLSVFGDFFDDNRQLY